MHHEFAACVYAVVCVLYLTIDDISAPFAAQAFEWRVYMTMLACVMIYEVFRVLYSVNDIYMFLCMQWSTYILCGGSKYPYWMAAYGAYVSLVTIVERAEQRMAEFEESARLEGLYVTNAHNADTASVTLVPMTTEQYRQAETLADFRRLRQQNEEPVGLGSEENTLWKMSDNTGMLYDRETRRWMVTIPFMSMLFLYMVWWNVFTWYIAVDVCMLLALLTTNTTCRFVVFHVAFLFALLYARYDVFNALQK